MKGCLLFSVFFIALLSCNRSGKGGNEQAAADKFDLINADKAFSALSMQKGMKAAFIEYIDSNGTILPPGQAPVEGAAAIDYISAQNDMDFTLTWRPRDGVISSAGDIGYTYGVYSMKGKESDSGLVGTYVTVWKRQQDGKWKFLFYSSNEGRTEALR